MIKKKAKFILILIAIQCLLTGCWDDSSIENKDIVSMVITDYNDNEYIFDVEIINVKGAGEPAKEQNKNKTSTLRSNGKTFLEARDELNRRADQQIFLGATRICVFTKRFAQKGIEEYLNRIRTEVDYRKSLDLVITSDEPSEFIKDVPENSATLADAIENTLLTEATAGTSFHMSVGNVLSAIAVKKVGFALPELNILEEEVTLVGFDVFKDQKCIGFISAQDRKGLVYLVASLPSFRYELPFKDVKIVVKTDLNSKKIKPKLKDNQLTFKIDMEFSSEIQYMSVLTPIKDEDILELNKMLEEKLKQDISKTIEVSQKDFKCDYLEFYKYFRADYQSVFKEVDWNEFYSSASINLNIKAEIKGSKMLEINPKS